MSNKGNSNKGGNNKANNKSKAKAKSSKVIIANNKKARFNYEIIETIEAGISLLGTEVKSLRQGKASIVESYATEDNGEVYLINSDIPPYKYASYNNHEAKRQRKLLLHKREINRLIGLIKKKGITLVPLSLYFNERGIVKVEIGVAKGKDKADKRETEKTRDWNRQKERLLKR